MLRMLGLPEIRQRLKIGHPDSGQDASATSPVQYCRLKPRRPPTGTLLCQTHTPCAGAKRYCDGMCSQVASAATAPRAFAMLPSDPCINDGLLWTTNGDQDRCTDWVVLAMLDLHQDRDALARIAAHVSRAVKRLLSDIPALLKRGSVGIVKIQFKGPWEHSYAFAPRRPNMPVESIWYNFGGAEVITVRVLNSSDLPHGLPCQEEESLKAMRAAGGSFLGHYLCSLACASVNMPPSPERVVYARRSCATGVCRRVPTSNDWFNARRFDQGDGSEPIDLDGVAVTNGPPTTGCEGEPLCVREVIYGDTSVIVWTGAPTGLEWAMVGPFSFTHASDAQPAHVRSDADFALTYLMHVLTVGIAKMYTGIDLPVAASVRSVTVIFPEGTPGDIEKVRYNLLASADGTKTIDVSIMMVPLCNCMRREEWLLDGLDKTACHHSLEEVLSEFATRRLHEAASIKDEFSSVPDGFRFQVPTDVCVLEHPFKLDCKLTAWCAVNGCPFLTRRDGSDDEA